MPKSKTVTHRIAAIMAGAVVAAGLSACGQTGNLVANTSNQGADPNAAAPPSFTQFADIPVPTSAKMNLDRTIVFGGDQSWIGRLVFSSTLDQAQTFDFYKAELPKFGWTEITTVRAANSVMTYQRDNRIATVQIQQTSLGGSEVNFTISPQGMPAGTAPVSGAPNGVQQGPAPAQFQ